MEFNSKLQQNGVFCFENLIIQTCQFQQKRTGTKNEFNKLDMNGCSVLVLAIIHNCLGNYTTNDA